MRKAKAAVALAVTAAAAAVNAPASAEIRSCLAIPPGREDFAPTDYGYRYDPYVWTGYQSNYSNFTPADCGYYDRRLYGARAYFRVRYIHRYYR